MPTIENLKGEKLREALREKSVAVLGLGRSGISAAAALKSTGAAVFLSESGVKADAIKNLAPALRKLPSEFGGHTFEVLKHDLIVVSPGIHLDLPLFGQARRRRIPIWSELELGWRLGRFANVAAITGTNGKTTTAALLGDMCERAGLKTLVGGNIGKPLTDFSKPGQKFDAVVLEVSSYQLEACRLFRPDASCVLNVTPDHMERHHSMAEYAKAKERIFMNQGINDLTFLNSDDAWCRKMAKRARPRVIWFSASKKRSEGIHFDSEKKTIEVRGHLEKRAFRPPKHLPGLHNVENACAAIGLALALKVPSGAIRESLENFKGVEHRIEKVKTVRGVTFVNDSKATNVDSTLKALEALPGPLWLILGGEDKGAPYAPLKNLIQRKARGVFLIGEASQKIDHDLRGVVPIHFSRTLGNAVKASFSKASPGDTVLLSPACASFDQFKNFEDRGGRFKALVRNLNP